MEGTEWRKLASAQIAFIVTRMARWFPILLFLALPAFAQADGARGAVVFFGDSLTAGFGLDPAEAYPALLRERIEAAGPYRVVNAGVSGDTTTGGLRRVEWVVRQPVAVFVLALGANDGLRGQPVERMEENLDAILRAVRARHPDARLVVAGMQLPRNLGEGYYASFAAVFPRVAERHGAALVPFLLDGVAAVPELNQGDQIHPNAEGQRRVADNVWAVLGPLLER